VRRGRSQLDAHITADPQDVGGLVE